MGRNVVLRPKKGETRDARVFIVLKTLPVSEGSDVLEERWFEWAMVHQTYVQPNPLDPICFWRSDYWISDYASSFYAKRNGEYKSHVPPNTGELKEAAFAIEIAIRRFFHIWSMLDAGRVPSDLYQWRDTIIPWPGIYRGLNSWPKNATFWRNVFSGAAWLLSYWFDIPISTFDPIERFLRRWLKRKVLS